MFVVQGRMKSRRFQALSPGQGGGFVQIRTSNTKEDKTTFESKMSWARMKEKNLIMNEPFPRVPSLCLTRGGGGVRRHYFVRKLEKGEKFRRENKDWCINLQFFFQRKRQKRWRKWRQWNTFSLFLATRTNFLRGRFSNSNWQNMNFFLFVFNQNEYMCISLEKNLFRGRKKD